MFAPTRYIAWAHRFFGKAPFDLATSGMPYTTLGDLGVAEPPLDDLAAYPALVRAIAVYNDVTTAEVVPALGTSNALFLAYASMLEPGDEVLVEHPGYEPLTRAAQGLGAIVRTFERRADEGFRVVPERVAARVTPRTRVIVVTNHHNPTGVAVPVETLTELSRIAEARGAYLLVDEVYAPLLDLPDDGVFRASARKLAPNVVAISSVTKCYGLGMYRVGWLLGPTEIVERAAAATISTCGHLPVSHAARGAVALANIGALAKRTRALLTGRQAVVDAWASSLPHATWSQPAAGLFGLVTLPSAGDLLPRIESWVSEHGVLVSPATFFGVPNGFRLSWATLARPELEQALAKLAPLLR